MELLTIGGGVQTIQKWMMSSLGMGESFGFYMTALVCVLAASVVSVGFMAVMWKYRRVLLRDRDLKLDRFTAPGVPGISLFNALRIPIPKFSFDLSGFRGIGFSLGVVAAGFAVAFSFVIVATDDTPSWPEAGAAYVLPSTVGSPLEPDIETPEQASQTLKINLSDGVRLSSLTLKDMNLGKASLTDCLEITRAQGNSSGWLYVDNWTATGVSAPSADFANAEIANMSLAAYVDGHTVEATIDSTITDLEITSTRGAGDFKAENSVVDRVLIVLAGNATVGNLIMENFKCSVGGWNVDYVKSGSFTLDSTSRFGDGDGINTADFVVQSTVKTRSFTDNLVDTPITVR